MKISILLVTYNRLDLLKKSLQSIDDYAHDIDELIIVDNDSSDETFEFLKGKYLFVKSNINFHLDISTYNFYKTTYKDKNVILIRLNTNTGGSGGFYTGIKYFNELSGSDWVWGMDDDAFIKKDALKELKKGIYLNPSVNAFWSNCNDDSEFVADYKDVDSWMFVGFCLNKQLINLVDLPVKDYFIYHDDSEYAERILRSNNRIIKIKNSLIEHGDFSSRNYWQRSFFGKTIKFPEMSDWKLYYYLRNNIHKASYSPLRKSKRIVKVIFIGLKLIFLRPRSTNVIIKSIFHGIINKKGKVISP
jgi:GT2 family glycosyltransferase